jgi:hypothetical protein
MDYATDILGTHVVTTLKQRLKHGLLVIGSDTFTRRDLATIDCYSFTAAANLSALLATIRISDGNRKITDTRDLFNHVPPEALVIPRLGSISLAVLGAAFEKKGLGGNTPLLSWIKKHHAKDAPVVTFSTMKVQEHKRDGVAQEQKAIKARKQTRRNKAHQLRTERFEQRTNGGTTA